MPRRMSAVVMLALVATFGCKQTPKEDAEPTKSPSPPTTATATATAAATAEPSAAPVEIPPPIQPTMPAATTAGKPAAKAEPAAKGESITACCTALHKEATEAPKDKGLYQTAAASCDAISKLVSAGTTKKAAALTQLRANLRGNKLPAGCE